MTNLHLKENKEILIIIILTYAVFFVLILNNFANTLNTYNNSKVNETIIALFGNLFGLMLTAYTILFGLVPVLNKEILETDAFGTISKTFFLSLILYFCALILGILISILDGICKNVLIVTQLFVGIFALLLTPLILYYLYLMLKIIRVELLKKAKISF